MREFVYWLTFSIVLKNNTLKLQIYCQVIVMMNKIWRNYEKEN